MKIDFIAHRADGGFGDVWEATDALGRRVAVKLFRSSGAAISSALDHARALARAQHANVVSVFSLETLAHPETGAQVECVVMEWLEGETLTARLRGARFTLSEVTAVGHALIGGLRHIHSQGLAHGDLHEENVMIGGHSAKIIDILYRDSLATLSTASRATRLQRDRLSLRMLLQHILLHSELDPTESADFNTRLSPDPSLDDIAASFIEATNPARGSDPNTNVEHSYRRVIDPEFVEGAAYASAMADDTSDDTILPLLKKLISERAATQKHADYLRLLWRRLDAEGRVEVLRLLGSALEIETPKGKWAPLFSMLKAFGREGWNGLTPVVRMQLENKIVSDTLTGRHDIYGVVLGSPGTLGTWSKSFWSFFDNPDRLVENLALLLKRDWYSQNYVGKHFMNFLPSFGNTAARRATLIDALVLAVRNDARVVVTGLTQLPADWQQEIAARQEIF